MGEFGEADAYGHRRKVDIGFALAEQIKARTGEEAVNSELTYDLRSGEADSLDTMVAITFANIAVDLIRDGAGAGQMVAIVDGKYAYVDIPEPGNPRTGGRRHDVRPGPFPAAVPQPAGAPAAPGLPPGRRPSLSADCRYSRYLPGQLPTACASPGGISSL